VLGQVDGGASIRSPRVVIPPPQRWVAGVVGGTCRAQDLAPLLLETQKSCCIREAAMVQSRGFVGRRGAANVALRREIFDGGLSCSIRRSDSSCTAREVGVLDR